MAKKEVKQTSKKKQTRAVKKPVVKVGTKKKPKDKKDKCNTAKKIDSIGRDRTRVEEKTAKNKARVLIELEKTFGIVTNAIAKVGISNPTFYRWFNEDREFAKAVEEIQEGFDVIVEDKLKQKIIQNDGHSIRFYLSHRVAKYKPKVGFGQDPEAKPIELIIETYNPDDDDNLGDEVEV